MRSQEALLVAPWGSWKEWDCVRAALFSASSSRIAAAIDRIAAWQCRGRVPVAVEITANIVSLHRRDPCIVPDGCPEAILPEDMLRTMYSMSIMRLVNGICDDKSTGSVLARALQAELPRSLVDIRHDSAHGELPAISLLRFASKQALEWLELFYWQQQKTVLECERTRLKSKLIEYFSLLRSTYVPYEIFQDQDWKHLQRVLKKRSSLLRKLVSLLLQSSQDVVSILIDDGLLAQKPEEGDDTTSVADDSVATLASVDDMAWKYTIAKLCEAAPQLLQMLALGIVRRLSGLQSVADGAGLSFKHEGGTSSSKAVENCTDVEANRLIDWLGWLLSSHVLKAPKYKNKSVQQRFDMELKFPLVGQIGSQLKRELLSQSLKGNVHRHQHRRLVEVVAAPIESMSSSAGILKLTEFRSSTQGPEEPQPDLTALESSLEKMKSIQVGILARRTRNESGSDAYGTEDAIDTEEKSRSRKRWKVSENWQPCAVGMLPSLCYSGGVRPAWLVDCIENLCTERDDKPPMKAEKSSGIFDKLVLDETESPAAAEAMEADQLHEQEQVIEDDEHEELSSADIKGCILLNGNFTRPGEDVLNSLSSQICVL